ncbi:MAG: hypothetical protein K1X89_09085 [Myxococcaceae bacterium]|nr:hypothetical protein [Myxococcaceae bacterium]
MRNDPRTGELHCKVLLVGPAGSGLRATVFSLVDALADGPHVRSSELPGTQRLPAGHMHPRGADLALASLELAALVTDDGLTARVRGSTLGFEAVRTRLRAGGLPVVMHLFWIPAELAGNRFQVGRMSLDWLSHADLVVFHGDSRRERRQDNAAGLRELTAFLERSGGKIDLVHGRTGAGAVAVEVDSVGELAELVSAAVEALLPPAPPTASVPRRSKALKPPGARERPVRKSRTKKKR